jgi:hypothetical protein
MCDICDLFFTNRVASFLDTYWFWRSCGLSYTGCRQVDWVVIHLYCIQQVTGSLSWYILPKFNDLLIHFRWVPSWYLEVGHNHFISYTFTSPHLTTSSSHSFLNILSSWYSTVKCCILKLSNEFFCAHILPYLSTATSMLTQYDGP